MALVLITHDMGVVAETAERVVGALCRPAGGGAARCDAPVRATRTIPIRRRCSRRCPSARRGRSLPSIPGVVPGQFDRPRGCLFSPRCAFATDLLPRRPPGLRPQPAARALPLPAARPGVPHEASAGDDAASRMSETVARGRDLRAIYAVRRGMFAPAGAAEGAAAASASRSSAARRWRWSANPAAASRRWRAWSP